MQGHLRPPRRLAFPQRRTSNNFVYDIGGYSFLELPRDGVGQRIFVGGKRYPLAGGTHASAWRWEFGLLPWAYEADIGSTITWLQFDVQAAEERRWAVLVLDVYGSEISHFSLRLLYRPLSSSLLFPSLPGS